MIKLNQNDVFIIELIMIRLKKEKKIFFHIQSYQQSCEINIIDISDDLVMLQSQNKLWAIKSQKGWFDMFV